MPTLDFVTGEVRLRFAAIGPVRAGKSSLLRRLHAMVPPDARGEISMRIAGGEEIISFDFKPTELVPAGANHASASLFAFTGESIDGASRTRHLADLDCVLFVVDSRPDRLGDNIASLKAITAMRVLHEVPVILLYNKRDLPDATPVAELQAVLNPAGAAHLEASTVTGEGCAAILGALVSAAFAAD